MVGDVVQVSAVSVARAVSVGPDANQPLPPHLEDIVAGSHPSLGENGRAMLRDILHKYVQVSPAPGEPVTGCTQAVTLNQRCPACHMWAPPPGTNRSLN